MGDVFKPADDRLSPGERYQRFTSSDTTITGAAVAQGDVLRVERSLRRKSGRLLITTSAGCDLGLTFNSRAMVYPRMDSQPNSYPQAGFGNVLGALNILSSGIEVSTSNPEVTVGAGATFEWQGNVTDVELTTWTAGTWDILTF